MSWENLIEDQGIFFLVIILLNSRDLSLDDVCIISLRENLCWSPLGLKGKFNRKNSFQLNKQEPVLKIKPQVYDN